MASQASGDATPEVLTTAIIKDNTARASNWFLTIFGAWVPTIFTAFCIRSNLVDENSSGEIMKANHWAVKDLFASGVTSLEDWCRKKGMKAFKMCYELAPSTNRAHLHVHVSFEQVKTRKAVMTIFGPCDCQVNYLRV